MLGTPLFKSWFSGNLDSFDDIHESKNVRWFLEVIFTHLYIIPRALLMVGTVANLHSLYMRNLSIALKGSMIVLYLFHNTSFLSLWSQKYCPCRIGTARGPWTFLRNQF